jgi:C-terminal lipocalin-like domain
MHMTTLFQRTLLAACAVVFLAFGSVLAQATNVTGDWEFTVNTDQGSGNPTMTFKQDGEKLTGKYNGTFGAADLTGTVKGNAIQFTFTIDVQGQQAPATYKGMVEKNTMKGTMDIAGMLNGTFTATKK